MAMLQMLQFQHRTYNNKSTLASNSCFLPSSSCDYFGYSHYLPRRKSKNKRSVFRFLQTRAKVESPRKIVESNADNVLPDLISRKSNSALLDMVPKMKIHELSLNLPVYDNQKSPPLDLLVVGAGPAGLAVAQKVSASGLNVCCIDPAPLSVWPNNYGVWVDEFEALGLSDCLDYTWNKAVVHLDDDREKFLNRPYGRVNRVALKTKMMHQCIENGVSFLQSKVDKVLHNQYNSVVTCNDGTHIQASIVLDATGFSRRLVRYDEPFNPGYQAAYGIMAEVESHPFDVDSMLFMDWRDSHLQNIPEVKQRNEKLPTFLYAMPLSKTKIFLEETSLVARPALSFADIQERLEARLKHLGINVLSIEEDEYCLIPMGGVLPSIPQRVLGIGGTAGMVHPSTGYMVARTLGAAPVIADSIVNKLKKNKQYMSSNPEASILTNSHKAPLIESELDSYTIVNHIEHRTELSTKPQLLSQTNPIIDPNIKSGDELSAEIWDDVWPLNRKEQREFFCFGMDVLLKLDLYGTRRFFDAFFDLSPFHWQGFLSSRLYLLELVKFGLSLFSHATNQARVEILINGTPGLATLITNVIQMRKK